MKSHSLKGSNPVQNSDTQGRVTQTCVRILQVNMYKGIDSSSSSLFVWKSIALTIWKHVTWHKISSLKNILPIRIAVLVWQQRDLVS